MTQFDFLLIGTGFLFIVLVFLWTSYNSFVKKLNQISEDFSDIDIQLTRRLDLISKLVEVVKGYAKHEKTIFEKVTELRSSQDTNQSISDIEKRQTQVHALFGNIVAVAEAYPNLKANESYQSLMKTMKETEDNIAEYREIYNRSVKRYNSTILTFPNFLAAKLYGFTTAEYFQAKL